MAVMTPPKKKKKNLIAKGGSFLRKVFGSQNIDAPAIASAKNAILKNKAQKAKLLKEMGN